MNNKEIERFLLLKRLFKIVVYVLWIALLVFTIIYTIVMLFVYKIRPNHVIFVDVISLLINLFLLLFVEIKFCKRRNDLVRKYRGVVTDEDKDKALELLNSIDLLQVHYFDLNNTGQLEKYESFIEQALNQIKNGVKVYNSEFESFKNGLKRDMQENKESIDKAYTSYISEALELIERNLCDF